MNLSVNLVSAQFLTFRNHQLIIVCNSLDLSWEQLTSLRSVHKAESFPGLEIPLPEVISMMTAMDPSSAIMAKAINKQGTK